MLRHGADPQARSAELLEPAAAEPFSVRQAVTQLSASLRAPTGEPSAPGRSIRLAVQHPAQPQGLQLQVWVQQGIQRQHGIGRQGAERLTPMQCNVQMAPPGPGGEDSCKTLQAAAHHLLVQQLQSVAADQHSVERSEPQARSLAGPRARGTEPLAQPREHGVRPPAKPLGQLQVYDTGPWWRPLPRPQKHVAEALAQRLAQPQEPSSETRAQPLPQGSASPADAQRGDEALELTATGHVCALPAAVQRGNEPAVSGATAQCCMLPTAAMGGSELRVTATTAQRSASPAAGAQRGDEPLELAAMVHGNALPVEAQCGNELASTAHCSAPLAAAMQGSEPPVATTAQESASLAESQRGARSHVDGKRTAGSGSVQREANGARSHGAGTCTAGIKSVRRRADGARRHGAGADRDAMGRACNSSWACRRSIGAHGVTAMYWIASRKWTKMTKTCPRY
ncbi:hypothetical protein CYMTET_10460 [Cymbomonas tetramitiformis]|uniref:Uncharacterized protein n=1 Tax=Cymbomonas tetramitiformis TaxID=36881 RepID=A0AAE0GP75_9CHLO|nr:hypothetical protein CYMTET_10460 [Cymbomonas tetramitiformis]